VELVRSLRYPQAKGPFELHPQISGRAHNLKSRPHPALRRRIVRERKDEPMEAQVHITGFAGTEVESRGNGTVSAFRLACTPRIRTKSGWSDGNTTWIEVACFRTLAQHVAKSVHKGDPVLVVGKLRTNVWEKDGQTYERLVLEADVVGHDLSRGTSVFQRAPRLTTTDSREPDEPPEDEADAAGLSAEERTAQAAVAPQAA
jgi:single-strand DNA-binding protein